MTATVHIPSPPLNTYIEGLYYLEGRMPYPREKIMPDARLDLKINLGGSINTYTANQPDVFATCSESWWVGLWNTYHVVDWPEDIQCFGISFKPGGAYPFLHLPLNELYNNVGTLEIMWGHFAAEIRERLYDLPTLEARFAAIEQLLRARLQAPRGIREVHYALAAIERQQGVISIQALSDHMGISQNHLGTLFKRLVGGTPKDLARLYRFRHVLETVEHAHSVDWTQVAHDSLYYDQSHFIKDFMAFTGHTPTEYLHLRQQVHQHNPLHAFFLRELPTN